MSFKAYCDGASRGNPGPSAYSYVIYDHNDQVIDAYSCYQGIATNNMAEHAGMNKLLHRLRFLDIKNAKIYCDSKLVINQLRGDWKVKHEHLKSIVGESMYLYFVDNHILYHIKGHSGIVGNELVDQLCNERLDEVEKNVTA